MDDAAAMRGGQPAAGLNHYVGGARRGQRATGQQQVGKVRTLQVLHDQVRRPVDGHAGVYYGRYVLVFQATGRLGLALKTGHDLGVAGQHRVQELDGEAAANVRVLCLVDLAHAARTNQAHQTILAARGLSHACVGNGVVLSHGDSPGPCASFLPADSCAALIIWSVPEAIAAH